MASQTQWTWVWADSGSWWWTGRPGVLQSTGSQRVGHYWATELNWKLTKGFPCGSAGKKSACNVGDLGLIPGLGRSPGEGKGYPLQCSGLENPVDCICIAHGVTESWTWLRDSHLTTKAKKTNTPQWNHFLFWIQIQQSKKLLPTGSHISYQDFQIFIWAWEAASFPNIMFNITLKNKMERLSP